jgi:hypothetical protein
VVKPRELSTVAVGGSCGAVAGQNQFASPEKACPEVEWAWLCQYCSNRARDTVGWTEAKATRALWAGSLFPALSPLVDNKIVLWWTDEALRWDD